MREPHGMNTGAGPWARLIEDHRRNVERLDAARPAPPTWWGLPLGAAVPWIPIAAALAWRDPNVVIAAVMWSAMLIPIGLACLFVQRLQPVAVGLLLGMGGALFTAQALLR